MPVYVLFPPCNCDVPLGSVFVCAPRDSGFNLGHHVAGMNSNETAAMNLTLADQHCLSAADGWLDLGDWRSALEELAQIPAASQRHPGILSRFFRAHSEAGRWDLALAAAGEAVTAYPDDPRPWINRSFALHELNRTSDAEALLLPALDKFPAEPIVAYNLACYACVLGRTDAARALLDRAYKIGDARQLLAMARSDPDLASLWRQS